MLESKDLCTFWTFIVILHSVITPSLQEILSSGETNDKYTIITAKVVEHPKNVTADEGDTILLRCKFNEPINKCVWFRNGTAVNIKDRYKFLNSTANGEKTNNCSIEISRFDKIDATHWQCSGAADSDSTIQTCKSNNANLTMNNSNSNNSNFDNSDVAPEPASSISPTNEPASSFLTFTNILLFVVIGLLIATIVPIAAVYCYRAKKAKINGNLKPPVALTELPNIPLRYNSSSNLNQSSESICTLCHQHKPEVCSPGGVWSAPCYDHRRDKSLPLPEVEENLPSYDEANLRHDESADKQYEQIPNRQSMDYYSSIGECQVTSSTMINAGGSEGCNRWYDEVPQEVTNQAAGVAEAECNPLYGEVIADDSSKLEADDDSIEVVRFETGLKGAIYTHIHPKKKSNEELRNTNDESCIRQSC